MNWCFAYLISSYVIEFFLTLNLRYRGPGDFLAIILAPITLPIMIIIFVSNAISGFFNSFFHHDASDETQECVKDSRADLTVGTKDVLSIKIYFGNSHLVIRHGREIDTIEYAEPDFFIKLDSALKEYGAVGLDPIKTAISGYLDKRYVVIKD